VPELLEAGTQGWRPDLTVKSQATERADHVDSSEGHKERPGGRKKGRPVRLPQREGRTGERLGVQMAFGDDSRMLCLTSMRQGPGKKLRGLLKRPPNPK